MIYLYIIGAALIVTAFAFIPQSWLKFPEE